MANTSSAPPLPNLWASRHSRFWIGAVLVFLALLWLISDVLAPFAAGIVIAYIFHPFTTKLTRRGLSRTTASLIVLLVFFMMLVGLLLALVPVVTDQVVALSARLPEYQQALSAKWGPVLGMVAPSPGSEATFSASLQETMTAHAAEVKVVATRLLSGVLSGGQVLLGLLSLLLIMPMVAFYLLRDWPVILSTVDKSLPRAWHDIICDQATKVDRVLSAFLRGQITVCLILGFIYAVGLTAIGLDFGFTLGFISGLLSFIPYVGAGIGLAGALGVGLAQFGFAHQLGLVLAVFAAGQILESQFITPKLVGESIGLHPLWIIFALMVGGSLFGFTGMLVALPVAAIIGVLTRSAYARYMGSGYYRARRRDLKAGKAQ